MWPPLSERTEHCGSRILCFEQGKTVTDRKKDLVDVHVHLLALPAPGNGCRISPRLKNGLLARALARLRGWPLDDADRFNRMYLERLLRDLAESERVGRAVILAMDGVYDDDGRLDEQKTDILISNTHCLEISHEHPCLLAGVSINPLRRDALDELDRCVQEGAALVKWLPNSQGFDPADPRCLPFYRALAARGMPLLSHIGYEFSLIGKDQSAGDLQRIRCALDEGVTVIAAHAASFGLFFHEPFWRLFTHYMKTYPNFHADVSALTLPNRAGMLWRLRSRPEFHGRLLFGTDYPLPVFSYPSLRTGSLRAWREAHACANPFDRHAGVLESVGIRADARVIRVSG